MPQNADGHWPPNVSAVIISKEEKDARLAQAPPGGSPIVSNVGAQVQGVPGAAHATIETKYIIPNQPNYEVQNMPTPGQSQQPNQTQADTDDFYGAQAIKLSQKMGVDIVWKTSDKTPIDLQTAKQLIATEGQNSVYFDFELLEDLPDPDDEIVTDEDDIENAIMAEGPTEVGSMQPNESLNPPQNVQPQAAPAQTTFQPPVQQEPVSERERLAWGGVLSTPGQTVYFRPDVIRVEVEGNVKVQKGIQGNVRMMRITRTTPQGPVQLANAIHTNVQPPLAKSPNPATVYRKANPAFPATDKVPIPKPQVPVAGVNTTDEKPDRLDEFDF